MGKVTKISVDAKGRRTTYPWIFPKAVNRRKEKEKLSVEKTGKRKTIQQKIRKETKNRAWRAFRVHRGNPARLITSRGRKRKFYFARPYR